MAEIAPEPTVVDATTKSVSEQLQTTLIDLIHATVDGAKAAKDFVAGQIPDVIHQLLMWKMTESLIIFVTLIGLTIVNFVVAKKFWNWMMKEDDLGGSPLLMISAFIQVFLFLGIMCHMDWLQIIIAPKLYLIEYLAHLARGVK